MPSYRIWSFELPSTFASYLLNTVYKLGNLLYCLYWKTFPLSRRHYLSMYLYMAWLAGVDFTRSSSCRILAGQKRYTVNPVRFTLSLWGGSRRRWWRRRRVGDVVVAVVELPVGTVQTRSVGLSVGRVALRSTSWSVPPPPPLYL
jgi:hypothetical protein